jgi:hypothetical protein
VYRVQGGVIPNASKTLITLDANGNPIIRNGTLNISIGNASHAEYFQTLRPGRGTSGSGLAIQHGSDFFFQFEQPLDYSLSPWRDLYELNWQVGCITSLHAVTDGRTFTIAMQTGERGWNCLGRYANGPTGPATAGAR